MIDSHQFVIYLLVAIIWNSRGIAQLQKGISEGNLKGEGLNDNKAFPRWADCEDVAFAYKTG